MSKMMFILTLVFAFTIVFAMLSYANVPPPPANQIIGIPDTSFNNLVEDDCRFCHEDPNIVDDANIPNRHHLLVGTAVPSGTCAVSGTCSVSTTACTEDGDCPATETCIANICERNDDCPLFDPSDTDPDTPEGSDDACSVHTDRPYPSGDTAGNYDCFSCHDLVWNPVTMTFELVAFRDCTICHTQDPLAPTVHHRTTEAKAGDCTHCHGYIDAGLLDADGDTIKNSIDPEGLCSVAATACTSDSDCPATETCLGAGSGWIPTYQPSLVTPCTSYIACGSATYKDVNNLPPGDPDATGGFCNYCHDADLAGVTDPDYIGVFGEVIPVVTNAQTHHSTGLITAPFTDLGRAECDLCHNVVDPDPADIRRCEDCHGIPSLHNIQEDSPAMPTGTIDPGTEDPWWGHIGNNNDCHGCHGFVGTSTAPGTGPIFPGVGLLSSYNIIAGADTGITVTGSAFTNEIMGNPLTSSVTLTAADGSEVTLTPDAISQSSMDITIPGTLATGNYILRAVKGPKSSNATAISIIPGVTITDSNCSKRKGVLTVNGSGFGKKPEGTDADINVEVNGQTVDIISWSDTRIKASVSSCRNKAAITVNTLYGSATSGEGGKPPKPPCKRKGCNK